MTRRLHHPFIIVTKYKRRIQVKRGCTILWRLFSRKIAKSRIFFLFFFFIQKMWKLVSFQKLYLSIVNFEKIICNLRRFYAIRSLKFWRNLKFQSYKVFQIFLNVQMSQSLVDKFMIIIYKSSLTAIAGIYIYLY